MYFNNTESLISVGIKFAFVVLAWFLIGGIGQRLISIVEIAGKFARTIPYTIFRRIESIPKAEKEKYQPTRLIRDVFGTLFSNTNDLLLKLAERLETGYRGIYDSFFTPQELEVMTKVNLISKSNDKIKDMLTIDDFRKKRNELYHQLGTQRFIYALTELFLLLLFVFASIFSLRIYLEPMFVYPNALNGNETILKLLSVVGPFLVVGYSRLSTPKGEANTISGCLISIIFFMSLINLTGIVILRFTDTPPTAIWRNISTEVINILSPFILILIASLLAKGILGVVALIVILVYLTKALLLTFQFLLRLVEILEKAFFEALDKIIVFVGINIFKELAYIIDLLINYAFVLLGQAITFLLLIPNYALRKRFLMILPIESFKTIMMTETLNN